MEERTRTGIYAPSELEGALRQGEILTELTQVKLARESFSNEVENENPLRADEVRHPFAIIVSQDCDLDWDYNARQQVGSVQENKLLPNVLFCETTTAESLRGREDINSGIWRTIRANSNGRYHFLQEIPPEEDIVGEGLPELALDFKRYFTIPSEEVYYQLSSGAARRCRLVSPYVEHLSNRFFGFHSRIALPSDHFSQPVST